MVISCSVVGCTNRQTKGNPNLHFHKYPLGKPEILKEWIAASGQLNWKPTKHSVLCSEHFTAESYLTPMAPGRMHLRHNAVPTLFNPQRSRRKRKVGNVVTSPRKAERKQESQESPEVDETFQNQFEAVDEQKEVEESVSELKEEEVEDLEPADCDADALTLAKLCDETFSGFVALPSSLWGMHIEHGGTFVAFSHLSENSSDNFVMTDKVVLLEADLVPKVFVRGLKLPALPSYFTNMSLQTFTELNAFLQEMESLLICSGTGLRVPASFSEKCTLYLHKKQRGVRCMSCSALRTRLKRSEAQRQRRADVRAGRKTLRNQKSETLMIVCDEEEEEEDGDDEEMQHLGEADEENEESAEDNDEVAYNET